MLMHDTRIALDMVFVSSEGKVVAIMSDEQPMSDDFISAGVPVAALIELNAGTAQAIGLLVLGTGVDLHSLLRLLELGISGHYRRLAIF